MTDDVCQDCGTELTYRISDAGTCRRTYGCDHCGTTIGNWIGSPVKPPVSNELNPAPESGG